MFNISLRVKNEENIFPFQNYESQQQLDLHAYIRHPQTPLYMDKRRNYNKKKNLKQL